MKKTGSFNSRSGAKKQPETKTSSLGRSAGKVGLTATGNTSAAFNRRSPVVTDATIATSSVIQAAADPKIKELVMKQQQIFERESMDKRTPRNREARADAANAMFHSLDHAQHSSHHVSTSHSSSFYKHAAYGDSNDANQNEPGQESPERLHGKYSAGSPDMHQHFMHQPLTPGSAMETVVHHDHGFAAQQDDDGVSSELTADAGYMTLQRSVMPPLPTMDEQATSISPATGYNSTSMSVSAGSPSMRQQMHTYMDMNNALLHDHAHPSTTPASYHSSSSGNMGKAFSDAQASPQAQMHAGLPLPPPLALPQAAYAGVPTDSVALAHATTIAGASAFVGAGAGAGGSMMQSFQQQALPDPRELDDQALRAAYLGFLKEMETRGLHSLSLNPSMSNASASGPIGNAGAMSGVAMVNMSSSSSCHTTTGTAAHANGARLESPPPISLIPGASTTNNTSTSTSGINGTPSKIHSNASAANLLPPPQSPHLNPNINPVDIRKNVPRSKSGGSESAFYPNSMFPGATASGVGAGAIPSATGTSASGGGSSGNGSGANVGGRKTPNSPLMGRYMHAGGSNDAAFHGHSTYHEELHWMPEPEDAELRKAFGQFRHPGSPSYPAYSPFHHLSSGAPQPSYLQQHNGHGQGVHHSGTTPTSVAVGSANWSVTSSTAPAVSTTTTTAATSHTTSTTAGHGATATTATTATAHTANSRSVSRCSGVIPQMDHYDLMHRHNCLSTLPQTHSQYMYNGTTTAAYTTNTTSTSNGNAANGSAVTANGANGSANGTQPSAAVSGARSVDLKTPKFVRKFQGIGGAAGLLGLTAAQRYAHMECEGEDQSTESEQSAQQMQHAQLPQGKGRATTTTTNTTTTIGGSTSTAHATVQVQVGGPGSKQSQLQQAGAGMLAHHNGTAVGHGVTSVVGGSSRSAEHHREHGLHTKATEFDNSIDAVKIAGGFDQLLLPGRLLNKRNSSLIPDEHSAFDDCSVGSMSLNSARSGGKKSAKTR